MDLITNVPIPVPVRPPFGPAAKTDAPSEVNLGRTSPVGQQAFCTCYLCGAAVNTTCGGKCVRCKALRGETCGAPQDGDALTPREGDVLRLLVTGASNKSIASRLLVSEGTIKEYIWRIFRKMGVPNRSSLIVLMLQAEIRQLRQELMKQSQKMTQAPSASMKSNYLQQNGTDVPALTPAIADVATVRKSAALRRTGRRSMAPAPARVAQGTSGCRDVD